MYLKFIANKNFSIMMFITWSDHSNNISKTSRNHNRKDMKRCKDIIFFAANIIKGEFW